MLVENLVSVTSYAPYPAIRPPCVAAAVTVLCGQTSPSPHHRDPLVIGWRREVWGLPLERSATAGIAGINTREDWSSGMVSTTVVTPLRRLLSTALLLSGIRLAMGGLVLRPSIKVLVKPYGSIANRCKQFFASWCANEMILRGQPLLR
jgi:hypothetical protein